MFARRWAALIALSTAVATPAFAQGIDPQCAALRIEVRDACQKGIDIFTLMAPQFNGAMAGGNAMLGTANTLGGLGKISIGVRATAVDGRAPELDNVNFSQTGAVRTTYATRRAPVPAPAVDVALGVFKGIPLGINRLFSLDAIANVAYVPNADLEDFRVSTSNGALRLGYGGRLGITRDGMLLPAISVSYLRRELPTTSLGWSTASSLVAGRQDSVALQDLSLRTESIRIAISKKLGFLELGGGAGQDQYRTGAGIRAVVNPLAGAAVAQEITFAQELQRRVAYGSLAINFPLVKLGVEAGVIQAGDPLTTFNTFTDSRINENRYFASAGLRISF